ncbi:MAG: hypothetical protein K2Y01_04900 [Rhabdochlamydiaceae bacterium]|nr:hypothetical protein [Rhabdochlamydiaceae bacterium]
MSITSTVKQVEREIKQLESMFTSASSRPISEDVSRIALSILRQITNIKSTIEHTPNFQNFEILDTLADLEKQATPYAEKAQIFVATHQEFARRRDAMQESVVAFNANVAGSRTIQELEDYHEAFKTVSDAFINDCAPADLKSSNKTAGLFSGLRRNPPSIQAQIENAFLEYENKKGQLTQTARSKRRLLEPDIREQIITFHRNIEAIQTGYDQRQYSQAEALSLLGAEQRRFNCLVQAPKDINQKETERMQRSFADIGLYLDRVKAKISSSSDAAPPLSRDDALIIDKYQRQLKSIQDILTGDIKLLTLKNLYDELLTVQMADPSEALKVRIQSLSETVSELGILASQETLEMAKAESSAHSSIQISDKLLNILEQWTYGPNNVELRSIAELAQAYRQDRKEILQKSEYRQEIMVQLKEMQTAYDFAPTFARKQEIEQELQDFRDATVIRMKALNFQKLAIDLVQTKIESALTLIGKTKTAEIKKAYYSASTRQQRENLQKNLVDFSKTIPTLKLTETERQTLQQQAGDLLTYISNDIMYSNTPSISPDIYIQNECYRVPDYVDELMERYEKSRDPKLLEEADYTIRQFRKFISRWNESTFSEETKRAIQTALNRTESKLASSNSPSSAEIPSSTGLSRAPPPPIPAPEIAGWQKYIQEGNRLLDESNRKFNSAHLWSEKAQIRKELKQIYDQDYDIRFPRDISDRDQEKFQSAIREIRDRYDRFCIDTAQALYQEPYFTPPIDFPILPPLPPLIPRDLRSEGLGSLTAEISSGTFASATSAIKRTTWPIIEPQLRQIPFFAGDANLQELMDTLPSDQTLQEISRYFQALRANYVEGQYGTLTETIRTGAFDTGSLEEQRKLWKQIAPQLRTIPFFNTNRDIQQILINAPSDECIARIAYYFKALKYRHFDNYSQCQSLPIKQYQSLEAVISEDYTDATLDPARVASIREKRTQHISLQLQQLQNTHKVQGIVKIKGDGNCYYRTIMYGYIKPATELPDQERAMVLTEMADSMKTIYPKLPPNEREPFLQFIRFLQEAAQNRETALLFDEYLLIKDSPIDRGMIMGLRYDLANWLKTKGPYYLVPSEEVGAPTILGDALSTFAQYTCGLEPTEQASPIDRYIEEIVMRWGQDAEGPVVDMALCALILPCTITNLVLEPRQDRLMSQSVRHPGALIEIKVLLKPGHFDLLYGDWQRSRSRQRHR